MRNIEVSPTRGEIDKFLKPRIHRLGDQEGRDRQYWELAELEGVEVHENLRNFPQGEIGSREYVFAFAKKEEWAKRWVAPAIIEDPMGDHIYYGPYEFYSDSLNFLQENGYSLAEDPENDDVVAYIRSGSYRDYFDFGLWQDGKVISKFGASTHVYFHDLDKVPSSYGNTVVFLRKNQEVKGQ